MNDQITVRFRPKLRFWLERRRAKRLPLVTIRPSPEGTPTNPVFQGYSHDGRTFYKGSPPSTTDDSVKP